MKQILLWKWWDGHNFIKAPCYLYYLLNVSSVEISLFICGVPHRKSSVEVQDMVWLTMNLLSCLLPLTFVHKVKKYHKNSWNMSDFQVWSWPIPTLFQNLIASILYCCYYHKWINLLQYAHFKWQIMSWDCRCGFLNHIDSF